MPMWNDVDLVPGSGKRSVPEPALVDLAVFVLVAVVAGILLLLT